MNCHNQSQMAQFGQSSSISSTSNAISGEHRTIVSQAAKSVICGLDGCVALCLRECQNQPYDCDNVDAFLYAGPIVKFPSPRPMHVYAQTYTDPENPFAAGYVKGTCQLPQITVGGVLDGYQHGRDLWSVYGDKLGFLPTSPNDATWFRSSESSLTQQSAAGVLRGMWPYHTGPVPLHQQPAAIDTTNESFNCTRRAQVLNHIESTSEWNAHLLAASPLFAKLSWATLNQSDWTFSFNSLADNFQARLCNGYQLPCNVLNISQCATMNQAEEVFRGGDWEWNYWYRTNPQAKLYIQTVEGPFIADIIRRLRAVQNGTSEIKYEHDFLHDNDVGPIAGALGINALRWPGMASNIAFEVWYVDKFQHFVISHPLIRSQEGPWRSHLRPGAV